jgi:hypothetical protein
VDAAQAGAIFLFYGANPGGLQLASSEFVHKNVAINPPQPVPPETHTQTNARYATALEAGDFDDDGFDDLAIGVPGQIIGRAPGQDFGGEIGAGQVTITYGSKAGITNPAGTQHFNQDDITGGVAEEDDNFGAALAVGDIDGDGRPDLVVGAPREDVSIYGGLGEVSALYSGEDGLTAAGSQTFNESQTQPLVGVPDITDRFGASLATGDFNNDGRADVAIGIPQDKVGAVDNAGSVAVLFGDAPPATATSTPTITNTPTITSTPTNTVPATDTPEATETPAVTNTATPTDTPVNSPTPTETDTPIPPTNTPTRTPTFTPAPGRPGDVNCNGVVNSIDAALEMQFIAALLHVLPCEEAADVDNDGRITSVDVALILQSIAGFIDL